MRNTIKKHEDRSLGHANSYDGESTTVNVIDVTEERDARALSARGCMKEVPSIGVSCRTGSEYKVRAWIRNLQVAKSGSIKPVGLRSGCCLKRAVQPALRDRYCVSAARMRRKRVRVITHELSRFTGNKWLCPISDRATADTRYSKIWQQPYLHSSFGHVARVLVALRQLW